MRTAPDDAGVLAALRRHNPAGMDRLLTFGETLAKKRTVHMRVLDMDDGYARGWYTPLVRVASKLVDPLMLLLRVVKPLPGGPSVEAGRERG